MEFGYATIMTWMKYLELGYWKIANFKEYPEEEILSKFNDLFRNELAREGTSDFAFNPYKGIGFMHITFDKSSGTFEVVDNHGYITCFYQGLFKKNNGKRLCLNKNVHGFYADYFKYLDKENDEYVFVSSIIEGTCDVTPNIRRMVNILFLRQQPICEYFKRKETIFYDYKDSEKQAIIKECQKY